MNKDWIDILSALLTPITSIGLVMFAYFEWRTNDLIRHNELFDRRYEFYKKLEKWWLQSSSSEDPNGADHEVLIPWAMEADFLFGDDISEHIMSLAHQTHTGAPWFPNEDFIRPFQNYLKLR